MSTPNFATALLTCAAGLAAALPALPALAGGSCDVNQYGMPDFDQRRELLNNDGSVHCVPTSISNILGYFATNGYPPVFPGVNKTYGQEDYAQITTNIGLMGSLMGTSPPGGTNGTGGLNGLKLWLLAFGGGNFSAYRIGGTSVTPTNLFVWRQIYGGYAAMCYGRYTFVGGATGWDRGGGHCITLYQMEDWCTASPTFRYRDPASDEGSSDPDRLDKQSTRATTSWPLLSTTSLVDGQTRTLWRMMTNNTDGVRRLLDSMYVIIPKCYISASGPDLIINPAFTPLGNLAPAPINTGGTINNLQIGHDGTYAIIQQTVIGGATNLKRVNLGTGLVQQVQGLVAGTTKYSVGRLGRAYTFNDRTLRCIDVRGNPIPELSQTLGFIPEGLLYDDQTDEVILLIPAGAAGPRLARYTKSLVPISSAFYPSLPGTGELKIKPGPQPGQYYIARAGDGSVRLLLPAVNPTDPYTNGPAVDLPGTDTLQDFHFHESGGLAYLRPNVGLPGGVLRAAKQNPSNGRWELDSSFPFFGRSMPTLAGGFTETRSSYDPAVDPIDDEIGPNPEVYPSVPDCIADIARAGQLAIPDGQLTADDIIVFVNWFFAADERADVAGAGQALGADGQFTADDIIVFINQFFDGCP
jgi:hypothetical protein